MEVWSCWEEVLLPPGLAAAAALEEDDEPAGGLEEEEEEDMAACSEGGESESRSRSKEQSKATKEVEIEIREGWQSSDSTRLLITSQKQTQTHSYTDEGALCSRAATTRRGDGIRWIGGCANSYFMRQLAVSWDPTKRAVFCEQGVP